MRLLSRAPHRPRRLEGLNQQRTIQSHGDTPTSLSVLDCVVGVPLRRWGRRRTH
ncbi:hypothetical protein BC834DRAFT_881034 [Gloeopeniophorella convolvens]|nr:hypothetical protein BC834DRAFT_881034 [Gloeopeniophorella convolvens]